MGSRSHLLFLSQCLPYPPHSGVTNRTFNILRQLQKEFDVTLLAFSRRRHQRDAAARDDAKGHLAELLTRVDEPIEVPSQGSRGRQVWDHLRSVFTGRPFTYYEYDSRAFGSNLKAAVARRPVDLVHLDSLDLYRWLAELPSTTVACTHHNIESDLLRRRAQVTENPLLARYIAHQARLTEQAEREQSRRFATNVMMSEVDASRLRAIAPGARTMVAPNGVDTAEFRPVADAPVSGRIVFLGPLYMFANREGMEFFFDAIWSRVRGACPGATLELVGSMSEKDRSWVEAMPETRAAGYVPSIVPHLAAASVGIVPLRVGGGTRLKILDYWALGKAVVSTSVGCEGLETVDGENILIRDDPQDFADAVVQVLTDPALRTKLERNARSTAETVYDWNIIGARLRAAYHSLLGGSEGGEPIQAPRAPMIGVAP